MARRPTRDLTVLATPFYFLAMAAEARALRRRRGERGESPADYERRDTLASLAMGQLSLAAPLVMGRLLRPLAPGRGRGGRWLLALAASALGVSAVADALARRRRARPAPEPDRLSEAERIERVAGVAAVSAVGLGALALTSWWSAALTPENLRRRSPLPTRRGPLALAVALVGWDLIYYWNHRFMHTSRYMWAMHVVHHSSERYNLSTALRQPVADALTTPIPYGLLCWLGVAPETLATARGVNLLYQFWIHTEAIDSLGAAESVLNSPSAHRVHHGSNRQYLDRNHGGILIVWDRLFGTFEPENERVVYGLTTNIGTFNPLVIIGHEYAAMARDVAAARTWGDRLGHVVRGPGWRPARAAVTP
jgi:sterol desaturase/sphingolipid hydroxylase (fatty acid hydroxylase superfamily)